MNKECSLEFMTLNIDKVRRCVVAARWAVGCMVQTCHQSWHCIREVLEASLVRGRQLTLCLLIVVVIFVLVRSCRANNIVIVSRTWFGSDGVWVEFVEWMHVCSRSCPKSCGHRNGHWVSRHLLECWCEFQCETCESGAGICGWGVDYVYGNLDLSCITKYSSS